MEDEWVSLKEIREWKPPEGYPLPQFDLWGMVKESLKKERKTAENDILELIIHKNDGEQQMGGITLTLDEQLAGIAEKLGQLDANNRGDLAELSRLTTLQNELLAQQALEVKVQVQEQAIESIVLPEGYDFDEISGVENMNLMIIEVVKDFQRKYNAQRNAEEQVMIATHRDELRASADRELQLKRQNDELQVQNGLLELAINEGVSEISQLSIERNDALSKRDAAVAKAEGLELLLSEKQAQIDTLREEIAIGAKAAINVTRIETTDRLASLVEASKQAKVKSALDIALENATPFRGKVQSGVQLDALEVQPFQPINQTSDTGFQLVTGPAAELPADDQVTPSEEDVQALPVGLVEGSSSEDGQSGKTIEERVRQLELHVFGV